jgi:hypothetical protein
MRNEGELLAEEINSTRKKLWDDRVFEWIAVSEDFSKEEREKRVQELYRLRAKLAVSLNDRILV